MTARAAASPPGPDVTVPERVATDTHDFAPYVRILGRGPGRSRSLTRAEARQALGMVLRGEATPEQTGAFLMLLRYRGEAVDEMAGLVEAARAHADLPWRIGATVDLDWPSYADGRTRSLPWYLLAALALGRAGVRVVMHGPMAGPGRQRFAAALGRLGIAPAGSPEAVRSALRQGGFAFVPLEAISPRLAELLALRGVLGLRSPLNTAGRLLDPVSAAASIDGVFHPHYIAVHTGAAALLGRSVTVLKGGGGEAEWTGAKSLTLTREGTEADWPPLDSAGVPDSADVAGLAAVWRGERADPGGEAAVIATLAVALFATRRGADRYACLAEARRVWAARLA